jgi:hypothetical protein
VSLSPFTMAAIAEAGLPVKSGAGQDRAGSSRTGLAGRDALQHRGSPDEQSASQRGAGAPRTPLDLQEHHRMSDFSSAARRPQEKSAICPDAVPLWYRLKDGRWLCRRVACKTKACPMCGPRLRARWAAEWAHAMAGDRVFRLVVGEGDPAKLRRRKVMRGQQLAHIPAPDGRRVVYTTAPIGEPVTDKIGSLTSDFARMPNDRRNRSMVGTWGEIVADAQAEAEARREPLGEYLGRGRRSLEQVEIVARELGLFLGWTSPDGLLIADPGSEQLEGRFCALIGLVRRKETSAWKGRAA